MPIILLLAKRQLAQVGQVSYNANLYRCKKRLNDYFVLSKATSILEIVVLTTKLAIANYGLTIRWSDLHEGQPTPER